MAAFNVFAKRHWRKIAGAALALLLAGCETLPTSGPAARDITSSAVETRANDRHEVVFEYVLVDISRGVLEHAVEVGPGSFFKSFGAGRGPAPVIRVGVGDVVQISIFESTAGGLFIPGEGGNRQGNYVSLPPQVVDRSGSLSVPYVGQVRAVGRSLPEIERDIEGRLVDRAIEPQVIAALTEQNASEVSLISDGVAGGGAVIAATNRFRIRQNGDRVLDVLSRAGGLRYPGYETFITLQRGQRNARVYFPTLINNPSENIYVAPGDVLFIQREQQKFVALGALASVGQTSGLTGQFAFEQERLSLNEAVAKAGGFLDERANPGGVFLYRLEYRDILEKLGIDISKFPKEAVVIPTIYRANFRDPSSLFFAQGFPMRHKDIIYVTNADAVEFTKFLFFLRSVTSTVAGVSSDAVVTRDSVRALRR